MIVNVLGGLVTAGLLAVLASVARNRHWLRLFVWSLWHRRTSVRLSVSALVALTDGNSYLLTPSRVRPANWGPVGGATKATSSASDDLHKLGWVFEPVAADLGAHVGPDLRGRIRGAQLVRFLQWHRKSLGRESAGECIRRELNEELEPPPTVSRQIDELRFQPLRTVYQGPVRLPTGDGFGLRIAEIVKPIESTALTGFLQWTRTLTAATALARVSAEELRRGRITSSKETISALAEGLIASKLSRPPDDPLPH